MQKLEFPALTAQDVEARVGQCNEKGATLLLYKDARCDMRLLDKAVGPERWQCRYEVVKDNLFCSVGIEFGGEWVWKQDVGVESNMEAQKGEASDAFKRACFKWGIGRELYTAPFIWVPAPAYTPAKGRNGKPTTYDRFSVERMEVSDGKITDLSIRNDKTGKTVFSMKGGMAVNDAGERPLRERTISKIRMLDAKADDLGMGCDIAELTSTAMFGAEVESLAQEQLNELGRALTEAITAVERGEA